MEEWAHAHCGSNTTAARTHAHTPLLVLHGNARGRVAVGGTVELAAEDVLATQGEKVLWVANEGRVGNSPQAHRSASTLTHLHGMRQRRYAFRRRLNV